MERKEEIEAAEKEIDAAFATSPLVKLDYAQAVWTLLSMNEDAYLRCGDSASHSDASAYSRVKLFTPPLPSVLPSTARIVAGSTVPAAISAMSPDTSPGPFVGMRMTLTEMGRPLIWLSA